MSQAVDTNQDYRVSNSLAIRYLDRNEGLTFNKSTANTYDGILNEFVQWLHDADLSVLTAKSDDVESYIEACVRRGNRESTLSSKLSTISELYRFVHLRTEAKKDLALDPLRLRTIDLDQYDTDPKIERKNLTREEIRQLFDAFNSYRNRLMAVLGVETGIRNSDIRGLRLQDIHEEYIHVHNPKGANSYDVPISDDLYFELDYWERRVRKGYSHAAQSEYVFPSQHGEKLESNGSFNKIIKDAASRAKIQKVIGRSELDPDYIEKNDLEKPYREWHRVTPHTLRHSYITLLYEEGVDLTYRMLVANHKNAGTNLSYTHGKSDVVNHIRAKFDPPR